MLIIDEQLLDLDEAIEVLVKAVVATVPAQNYRRAKTAFEQDLDLQKAIASFIQKKEDYEKNAAYAAFRPEIKTQRQKLYALKRQLDVNETLVTLRRAEVELQEVLAGIAKDLSQVVSEDIFVDTGLPLAPHKRKHKPGDTIRERSNHEATKTD